MTGPRKALMWGVAVLSALAAFGLFAAFSALAGSTSTALADSEKRRYMDAYNEGRAMGITPQRLPDPLDPSVVFVREGRSVRMSFWAPVDRRNFARSGKKIGVAPNGQPVTGSMVMPFVVRFGPPRVASPLELLWTPPSIVEQGVDPARRPEMTARADKADLDNETATNLLADAVLLAEMVDHDPRPVSPEETGHLLDLLEAADQELAKAKSPPLGATSVVRAVLTKLGH